jgi:hypothetical protein
VRGRSRKSKNFTLPGNPGAAPPALPMTPSQAQRAREVWLIYCFTAALLLHWRSRVDAVSTMTMMVAIGGPAVGKREAAELLNDGAEDAEDYGRPPTIAMLLAATRWVVAHDLHRSQSDLWSRPPIRDPQRLGASPCP